MTDYFSFLLRKPVRWSEAIYFYINCWWFEKKHREKWYYNFSDGIVLEKCGSFRFSMENKTGSAHAKKSAILERGLLFFNEIETLTETIHMVLV